MSNLSTKILLREAIRMMLSEAGEENPLRTGAALDFDEKEAKATYEKSKAELEKWDAENAKKEAFLAKIKQLGFKPGAKPNKATRELKTQPQYNYDQRVLATKRETLVARLEKAADEYGAYEPSAVGFKRSATGGSRSPADMEMPDKDSTVYFPIDKVKPLQWYTWKDERWVNAVKNIAYGSSSEKSGEEQAGTGPGEERLATIFGGKMQGGGVSFDVVTPDGRRWEVKALDKASTLIRPGTEGRAAFDKPRKQLEGIIKQIKNFTIVAKKLGVAVLSGDEDDKKIIEYASGFINDELEMFSKGEIPPERFKALRAVLKALSLLKNKWSSRGSKNAVDTTIGLGKKEVNVDKPTFIDVAKRVQKSKPEIDVLSNFEEREIALSTLKDDAFENPSEFFNDWFDSVDIERVFSQVDGVFIVSPTGFNMVPRPLFKKAFKFKIVSQGSPRFQFVYY